MCGLCGVFGVEGHWTDAAGGGASGRAERQHRVRVANKVLGLFGLRLADWMGRYTVQSRTGRGAVIDHLGAVWPMAERLAGRACDPLDERVIERVEALAAER